MPSQKELDNCYMQVALSHAELSKAQRKKVGACLVTKTGIIIPGYNGMSQGGSNTCEYLEVKSRGLPSEVLSKKEVIHAELNCLLKSAKEGISIEGCNLWITLSPCLVCSEMLIQAGVKEVIYLEKYRDTSGIDNLLNRSIICRQIEK